MFRWRPGLEKDRCQDPERSRLFYKWSFFSSLLMLNFGLHQESPVERLTLLSVHVLHDIKGVKPKGCLKTEFKVSLCNSVFTHGSISSFPFFFLCD